ncbi:MAG: outer membrane beta-barrel protein [Pseudomonadota bacterium]
MRPAPVAFAAIFATLLGAPALAQEVIPLDPNPAPVLSTQQFGSSFGWTGAYVGGSLGYANGDPDSGFGDDDAFIGGFRLGYDQDIGNFVIGGRIDYDFTELDVAGGEIDGIFRAGARIGFDQGRNLFYGIGGYADTDTSGLGGGDGFFVGGGYEVFLTDRITAGAEVLYHDLGSFNGGVDVEVTTATVGLNFRF